MLKLFGEGCLARIKHKLRLGNREKEHKNRGLKAGETNNPNGRLGRLRLAYSSVVAVYPGGRRCRTRRSEAAPDPRLPHGVGLRVGAVPEQTVSVDMAGGIANTALLRPTADFWALGWEARLERGSDPLAPGPTTRRSALNPGRWCVHTRKLGFLRGQRIALECCVELSLPDAHCCCGLAKVPSHLRLRFVTPQKPGIE